jgi:hypothetical protein
MPPQAESREDEGLCGGSIPMPAKPESREDEGFFPSFFALLMKNVYI